ncbi:MAG: hypothetical protein ACD_75C01359G0002, partial [uncultured bacterium]
MLPGLPDLLAHPEEVFGKTRIERNNLAQGRQPVPSG